MTADSDSHIAWQRVQLKRNRTALNKLAFGRFRTGQFAAADGQTEKAVAELKRKISEAERCIANHKRRIRRPLDTNLRSLSSVNRGSWVANAVGSAPSTTRMRGSRATTRPCADRSPSLRWADHTPIAFLATTSR